MANSDSVIRWEPTGIEDNGITSCWAFFGYVGKKQWFGITRDHSSAGPSSDCYALWRINKFDSFSLAGLTYGNDPSFTLEDLFDRAEELVPDLVKLASLKDER